MVSRVEARDLGDAWAVGDRLIFYKNRLFLLLQSPLVNSIVTSTYDSSHEGVQKTLRRIRKDFYWEGLQSFIHKYFTSCSICQRNKAAHLSPTRLLQPLFLPDQIWTDLPMNFIVSLPKLQGKSVLFVVVHHFSKYDHFIPIDHPFIATTVTRVFF